MRADVRHRNVFVGLGFGALALLGGARHAAAQTNPSCSDATMFPNPIYLTGSTAFEPTARQIAVKLSAQAVPHTLVYTTGTVSCDGYTRIQNNTTLAGTATHYVLAADGVTVTVQNCTLDTAGATPVKADVGVADVFYEWCPGNAGVKLPAGFGDFLGPVQAMEFVVPAANTSIVAISAEQAQDIWGCGATSGVGMFTDPAAIQQRGPLSGTQIMVSKYINVPAGMFQGNGYDPVTMPNGVGGGALVTSLRNSTNPQGAIGFVAADLYAANAAFLNPLAFKGFGQTKAYFADSMYKMLPDKQNVRDGHYMIFGPEHFIAPVGTDGMPTNANAKLLIDWVQGNSPIESGVPFGYVDIEAKAGMVPQCAMKVTRDTDGGFLKPFKPKVSCGCYFEKVVNNGTASAGCMACSVDSDCTDTTKTCQTNFCEAK